jgi:hypothetical protein
MKPIEALYWIVKKVGPCPVTKRDDNLSFEEIQLREALHVLRSHIENTTEDSEAEYIREYRLTHSDLKTDEDKIDD